MTIGLLINGGLTYYCGSQAIHLFRARLNISGWICVVCSSWNLALVMKYVSDVL
jgi:hypothetical protein